MALTATTDNDHRPAFSSKDMARVACLSHVRYLVLTDPHVIEHFRGLQQDRQAVATLSPRAEQADAYRSYWRRVADTAVRLAGFVPPFEVDDLASEADDLLST